MTTLNKEFLSLFHFSQSGRGLLGAETEYFVSTPGTFRPVPESPAFLRGAPETWGYELSACQVEHHTSAVTSSRELVQEIATGMSWGSDHALRCGLELVACEVAPEDMPLDVYVADLRYKALGKRLPPQVLLAANRVAGTHIHFGAGSIEEALRIHNALALCYEDFLRMGDHSSGERIRLYKVMAPRFRPPIYSSVAEFCEVAREQGFDEKPRGCYHFVRINPTHGTVEVRAFGIPSDPCEVYEWAETVRQIACSC